MNPIADAIRAELTEKNTARDLALLQSRELIRYCAECIRAVHRHEWSIAEALLGRIDSHADAIRTLTAPYPALFYAGYTQDALKECVEAHVVYAIVRQQPLPDLSVLHVEGATYLNGMSEAATELRRYILDLMRRSEEHSAEAERLLAWMDAIYDQLVTFDFPDAITGGLRRQTDVLRSVLERTRGDLTMSLRQQRLQDALNQRE